MGGGIVTRPDFGIEDVNERDPMTEFYRLMQKEADRTGAFTLPGAWAYFKPPVGERLYEDNLDEYCRFSAVEQAGWRKVFAPQKILLLYHELRAVHGVPAALVLTQQASHRTVAVQLLAPFADEVPAAPDCTAVLRIQLTHADILLADTNPDALAQQLNGGAQNATWLRHPDIARWRLTALATAQKLYGRR